MAELAAGMRGLRGFLHVSTAYVNSNFPRGSHVEERMYPLSLADGRTADHAAIAAELLALPPASAERQARPRSIACYAKVVSVPRPVLSLAPCPTSAVLRHSCTLARATMYASSRCHPSVILVAVLRHSCTLARATMYVC